MLKRLVAGWCAVVVIAVAVSSAPLPPEAVARLDALFARWNTGDTPGVIIAVAKDGETVFAKGYGVANLEHATPLTPETISESGSVAKQFTAAAVVLLAERGKLSLEDPICRHFPELPANVMGEITVRMLLNHTSGLRDIHGLFDLQGRPSYTSGHDNEEVLRVLSRQKRLNFEAGTEYLYTNSAYILAALLVERATGEPFATFCDRELFQPLGLAHTRWRTDFTTPIPGRASGYSPAKGGGYRLDMPVSNLIGNGGLLLTVGDLLRWNASLDRTDGEWGRVVRQLQTPSRLKDGRELTYGLGLTLSDFSGLREVSHGGRTAGFLTYALRLPERGFSLALLGNSGDFVSANLAADVARIVLELPRPEQPVAVEVLPAGLELLGGFYYSAQLDEVVPISFHEGHLRVDATNLIPLGNGRFAESGARREWLFPAGKPGEAILTANGARIAYVRRAAVGLLVANALDYTGAYRSDELDTTYQLELTGRNLELSLWPRAKETLRPLFADGFRAGQWLVTFVRDGTGRVVACELSNGRCRRVRLERVVAATAPGTFD